MARNRQSRPIRPGSDCIVPALLRCRSQVVGLTRYCMFMASSKDTAFWFGTRKITTNPIPNLLPKPSYSYFPFTNFLPGMHRLTTRDIQQNLFYLNADNKQALRVTTRFNCSDSTPIIISGAKLSDHLARWFFISTLLPPFSPNSNVYIDAWWPSVGWHCVISIPNSHSRFIHPRTCHARQAKFLPSVSSSSQHGLLVLKVIQTQKLNGSSRFCKSH
jgi:hypothetical protein